MGCFPTFIPMGCTGFAEGRILLVTHTKSGGPQIMKPGRYQR